MTTFPRSLLPRDPLRAALLAAVVLWLSMAMLLPMALLLARSVRAELLVRVEAEAVWFGPVEVRADRDAVFVGGEEVAVAEGSFAHGAIRGRVEAGSLSEVTCATITVQGEARPVRPVAVTLGDPPSVDGVALGPGEDRRTVTRSIGLAQYAKYFQSPGLRSSLGNSLFVSVVSMFIATLLAFVYAYALTRSRMPGRGLFRTVAMAPIFAPTMLYGLSLVYLFGNKGLVTTGFFGAMPWLAWDIGLYGPVGIIIAEVVFIFPAAVVILTSAFLHTDARLYEAASSLGAPTWRVFLTVTLPGVKYGLASALFATFTLAFTDFGAPKIVGGMYNVLAVDIYKQVIGQQNFGMGATVSMILLVPSMAVCVLQRLIERRHGAAVSARSVPWTPPRSPWRDVALLAACGAIAGFILLVLLTAGAASLVQTWPYDFSLSLRHYTFRNVGGGGYQSLWNSVMMATVTALAGTAVTFAGAYLVEKTRNLPVLRQAGHFLSMAPLALPGLVIGIAYIFFFNAPSFSILGLRLPNPFQALYGTMAILVLSNIVHFYTVAYLTATTALRQLDPEFEAVSESMGVPFYRTFARVTAPLCLPSLVEIAAFYFVNAMATVSAVIFLYSETSKPASVAVVSMSDAGDTAPAAAMCMLILLVNLVARGALDALGHLARRRTDRWKQRA